MAGPEPNPVTDLDAWLAWKAEQNSSTPTAPKAPAGTPPAPTGAALPGTGAKPPALAPYTPTPRAPYGNITTEQITPKTIQIGQGVRLDPVSRQKYTEGSDHTWRTGGTSTSTEVSQLVKTFGLPPERQTALQDKTNPGTTLASNIALSANPGLSGKGVAGTAGFAGNLDSKAGITVPGMEGYNVPGAGVPAEGRHTLYGANNELNTLHTGGQGSAQQIPITPGFRNFGQVGNSIAFGSGGSGNRQAEPQMNFAPTAVSVPDSYVKGSGNTGDANRALDVPFNIGQGGSSSFQLAGNNVQMQSADKGTGTGFAINAMPSSNVGNATARDLSNDPALQAAQTLQLMAAIKEMGGGPGAISALTATNPNQYGGFHAGTGNAPISGNGGSGQGTWFGGAAPGPQNTPFAVAQADKDKEDGNGGFGPDGPQYMAKGGDVSTGGNGDIGAIVADAVAAALQKFFGQDDQQQQPEPEMAMAGASPQTGAPPPMKPYAAGGDFISMGKFGGGAAGPLGIVAPVTPGQTAPEVAASRANTAAQSSGAMAAPAAPAEAPVTNDGGVVSADNGYSPARRAPTTPASDSSDFGQISGSGLDPAALQPWQDAATSIAGEQHARAGQQYIRSLAGLGAEQAVPIVSGQATGALGPGQYWDKGGALTRSISSIAGKQQTLSEMGAPEDYAGTQAQIAALQQRGQPYKNAMTYQTQLQGLGDVGDPEALQNEINALKQQSGPLSTIQDAQSKLTELGQYEDLAPYSNQIANSEDWLNRHPLPDKDAPDNYAADRAAVTAQLNQYKNFYSQAQSKNNAITLGQNGVANLLKSAGLTQEQIAPMLANYQTQLSTKGTALQNAQQAAQLKQTIASLVGSGVDPIAKYAEISGQLDPLQSSASGMLSRNSQRSTLGNEIGNLVSAGPPKFGKGGSMVTDEPVVGMGMFSKQPRFVVGEPVKPGGPPRAEKLTGLGTKKMHVKPLHRNAVPMGKFARAA